MNELLRICLIVCPLIFAAGFVDSVAGGGGIISIAAYMLAGLPAHMAVGTNKSVMSFGTALATVKYLKSGKVILKVALLSAVGSIIGAYIGSSFALVISERALKLILLTALPAVAVFLALKKNLGEDNTKARDMSKAAYIGTAFGIGLVIGGYDGLIGPGTGTFLILAFSGFLGTDLLTSSGCAKVSNLASNITSMVIYIIGGKVLYAVALPAVIFCMAGNWLGARYALKGGSRSVRKVMFVVLALLFVKIILELCGVGM